MPILFSGDDNKKKQEEILTTHKQRFFDSFIEFLSGMDSQMESFKLTCMIRLLQQRNIPLPGNIKFEHKQVVGKFTAYEELYSPPKNTFEPFKKVGRFRELPLDNEHEKDLFKDFLSLSQSQLKKLENNFDNAYKDFLKTVDDLKISPAQKKELKEYIDRNFQNNRPILSKAMGEVMDYLFQLKFKIERGEKINVKKEPVGNAIVISEVDLNEGPKPKPKSSP